jgi:hypothetical protein
MSYNCFAEEVAKGPQRHVAAQVSTIPKTAITSYFTFFILLVQNSPPLVFFTNKSQLLKLP